MLNNPYGVVFLPWSEHILVSDYSNHRVQVFDKNGKFVAKWGSSGSSPGQFNDPIGITFNSQHQIIVADKKNNRLQIFG